MYLLLLLSLGFGDGSSLSSLIAKHKDTLDRIHAIDLVVEQTIGADKQTYGFIKLGDSQRGYIKGVNSGRPMFFDGSKDSKSQRVLSGFNPDKNLVLSPRNQIGISGDLGPLGFQGDQGMFFAHAILLLKIQTAYQGFLGLEELAKMASQCNHVGTERDGAKHFEVLECSLPGKGPEQTNQHFRVYLDESQDYLISRVVRSMEGIKRADSALVSGTQESVVVRFKRLNGIPFPMEAQTTTNMKIIRGEELPPVHSSAKVISVKLNEPIDESRLVTQFPKGLFVREFLNDPKGGKSFVTHYWGDGKPAKTFATRSEYDEFMKDFPLTIEMRKPFSWSWWVMGVVGLAIVLITGILLWARVRSSRIP